jgi:hypothetical protein
MRPDDELLSPQAPSVLEKFRLNVSEFELDRDSVVIRSLVAFC